ncbi:MAG: class I SAM-dependent methyltransferase family protein [Candidatus Sifarchaeia archaeon]
MRYREFLRSRLKDQIPSDIPLPGGFHLVGHVALLHADSRMQPYLELVGETTLQYDSRITSVAVRMGATSGVMRVPDYVIVAGGSQTITTHIENGVRFRLDPTRITFSGGNKTERLRMGSVVKSGERVLDMFACVGQFALHMAKNRRTRVQAIELSSDAYQFLVSSIRLNGFEDRVVAVLGDCRELHPVREVNRVVMGYLHDTHHFLPYALKAMVAEGGTVHMHIAVPVGELEQLTHTVKELCLEQGFSSSVSIRQIKTYAPGIQHFVFDIELTQL